jgi:hypothetical protein
MHPLFSQSFSSSQSTTSYAQPSLNLTDAFGRLIPASGAGVSGTPYVFDQFGLGKGIFINGVEFEESDLNYSYFDHNLYFTKGNQLYKVNYPIKSFILNGVDKDYNKVSKEFLSLFPSIDNNSLKSCPIPETKIMDEIDGIIGKYEPLKFVRSAKIDNDKYWVWVYKNISGNVWNWYITVKQDEENRINIERHRMHGGVNKTPEKLLLEYHYNS